MENIKEQIIKVALDIIGKEGIQKVTIREIAARAGVNVAAVNYHFGSKANLIGQSIAYFIQDTQKTFKILERNDLTPEAKLRTFLNRYFESSIAYPGVIKSLIGQMMENGLWPEIAEAIKGNFHVLTKIIGEFSGIQDPSIQTLKAFQTMSCLSYPILLINHLPDHFNIDYEDPNLRAKYIELVLNNIMR